ncbi:unnamed protein product, partial [Lymnaea stagnalis]
LISQSLLHFFIESFTVVCGLISLLGCVGKVLIMKAFISLGLKDVFTISFVFVAGSDLVYLLVVLGHIACLALIMIERNNGYRIWFATDPFCVHVFISNLEVLLYLIPILNTTFLAVVRCACVTMPLHFRNMFTRVRSLCILVSFCLLAFVTYLPVVAYMKIEMAFDERVNSSRLLLWISPKRDEVKVILWIIRDVAITLASQVIIITCVIIMARSLRTTLKFRQEATGASRTYPNSPCDTTKRSSHREDTHTTGARGQKLKSSAVKRARVFSQSELSIVRQVVVISTVYIVCNTPKILTEVTALFVPDLTLGKAYENMYTALLGLVIYCQSFGSSINFLIYYRYNTKFRQRCRLFRK